MQELRLDEIMNWLKLKGTVSVLNEAYFSALDALPTDGYAGLFITSGRSQYNPRDVLASMIFGGSTGSVPPGTDFGSVTLGRMRLDAAAVTVPNPKTSVMTGTGVVAASATIVLNRPILVLLCTSIIGLLTSCSGAQVARRSEKTEDAQAISICDLLQSVRSYRGKTVTVRGIYWSGLRQACTEPFSTGDHTWPSAINLVDSDYVAGTEDSVRFKTDCGSWDRLDEIAIREGRAGRREEIWVTMTGKLRAPQAYIRKDGRVVGGYGHLGVFPAELVVERVFDVEIRPNPTYNYKEILRRR